MSDMEDLVDRGAEAVAHSGVKGMRWGVSKSVGSDGSGSFKVRFRPTYTTGERRSAQGAVNSAGKSGVVSKDAAGFDQARLAQLRTPSRRVVNTVGGTKVSNITRLASITSAGGAFALTGDGSLALATAIGSLVPLTAAAVYDAHKIYFTNLVKNPSVKLKTDLSPGDMAKYTAGKTVTKEILNKRGSATVVFNKKTSTVFVRDREGRPLGSQTKTAKPTKAPAPKKS